MNKAVVKMYALGWLFLLRLMMHGTIIKLFTSYVCAIHLLLYVCLYIPLSTAPHYPTVQYVMLFYNFVQTKTRIYWKGQKKQLLPLYQFHIRIRTSNGLVKIFRRWFCDAFPHYPARPVQFRSDNRATTVFPFHTKT
jgi:hypothetical protein